MQVCVVLFVHGADILDHVALALVLNSMDGGESPLRQNAST